MSVENITIIILVGYVAYFALMWFLMRWTFKYDTLNRYIFKRSLQKPHPDMLHYVELAMIILLLIAILTAFISLIQILIKKKSRKNGENK